jgi:hypothetical protein
MLSRKSIVLKQIKFIIRSREIRFSKSREQKNVTEIYLNAFETSCQAIRV